MKIPGDEGTKRGQKTRHREQVFETCPVFFLISWSSIMILEQVARTAVTFISVTCDHADRK